MEQDGDVPVERSKTAANVANACTNCQKRRTKVTLNFPAQSIACMTLHTSFLTLVYQCDGKSPCLKCTNRLGSICTYEISLRASKTQMKRENTQLRQELASSTQLLTALSSGHEVSSILQGLRDQVNVETIAQRIAPLSSSPLVKRSSSADSCGMTWSHVPLHGKHERSLQESVPAYGSPSTKTSSMRHESDLSTPGSPYESPLTQPSPMTLDASSQTPQVHARPSPPRSIDELRGKACRGPTDLSDHRLIKHLFSIYWVWVHPAHTILDMEQFVRGYETGSGLYCSSYLIYAVCIAACDYLDPLWENVEGKSTDVAQLRQNLVAEARILKTTIDPIHKNKPTIQASAILSFVGGKSQNLSSRTLV